MQNNQGALPAPNWDLWAHMPELELWQAAALSIPIAPEAIYWKSDGMGPLGTGAHIDFARSFTHDADAQRFGDRHELLGATFPRHRVKTSAFVHWASQKPLFQPLPAQLQSLIAANPAQGISASVGGRANWAKWKLIPRTDIWKAVCLSFDREPNDDIYEPMLRSRGSFTRSNQNLQDRLEILQANLSTNGPIRPQGPLYQGMLQSPGCLVLLSEVAAFLTAKGIEVPTEMVAFAGATESNDGPEQETKEQREDRRLQMCQDAGLKMDKKARLRMPDGIGKVAETEGVTRQTFTEDVKNGLERKLKCEREGSGSR